MKVRDKEEKEAGQGGQSRGENHQPHQAQVQELYLWGSGGLQDPVSHSTCSEPPVGWAAPSRGRALSRRGNNLTSWVRSRELDILCPQTLPSGACGACRPLPAALGKLSYSTSLYTWENVEQEVKDFHIHNVFISLANFFYFISFKKPGLVFIISRAFKFFNLFICFYLHDCLSTTFCGLFLTT